MKRREKPWEHGENVGCTWDNPIEHGKKFEWKPGDDLLNLLIRYGIDVST